MISAGILLDEFDLSHFSQYDIRCYCSYCQDLFRDTFAADLPVEHDWDDPIWCQFVRWRYQVTATFLGDVKTLIKSIKPEVSLDLVSYATSHMNWRMGQSAEACADAVDYLTLDIGGALNISQTARFFRAFCRGRPELITGLRAAAGLKSHDTLVAEAMTAVANGAAFGVDFCYHPLPQEGVWDPSVIGLCDSAFSEITKREEWLSGIEPVKSVGLFYSENSRDFHARDDPAGTGPASPAPTPHCWKATRCSTSWQTNI